MILHIDMDAFFASIEQAINPALKDKPLIVGSRGNKFHTVVCAASYEAKRYGISSGMPSREAFQLCPELNFVSADQNKYIWTSDKILELLHKYKLPVERASIDEFRLDVDEKNDPQALAQEIRKDIRKNFQITASIGIAKNCLLAKLASKINKPDGIAMITDKNLESVLAVLPAKKLCGVGSATDAVLDQLGIKTCLELYRQTAALLYQHLGQAGLDFYASLRATESIELGLADEKPKSIGHSYTLPRASRNPVFIRAWIRLLTNMAAKRLREADLSAKTVHLWLNGPKIGNITCQKTFSQATNDDYEISQRAVKIMTKTCPQTAAIRALGVACGGLGKTEGPPLFIEQKRRGELLKALDAINDRFGEETIYPAVVNLTRPVGEV